MNIENIRVNGLFDRFDHDLEFHTNERVMIMIGPNGFGKTTTLRLIDVMFNQSMGRLAGMPFRSIEVSFDVGTSLAAVKEYGTEQDEGHLPLKLIFRDGSGEPQEYHPQPASMEPDELRFAVSAIDDLIPVLDRVGPGEWRNMTTGEVMDLDEVLMVFQDELPQRLQASSSRFPKWLENVRNMVAVRFIDTERLTRKARRSRWRSRTDRHERTVQIYSQEVAVLVSKFNAEYVTLSQSLDRTFLARLVGGSSSADSSMETLRDDLAAIKHKRSVLEEAGLLTGDQASIEIPDLERVDKSLLSSYAQDNKQKLGVFDDLYRKVSAFMRIANSRLRYKQVAVSTEGLNVISSAGTSLDLELLSSGEQHELVILYELIFRTSEDSLILIDEPELSMHVAWQEQFVEDLEEMAKLSDFRAILATHSPEIIGDRWDLAIKLQGPNGE